MLRRAEREMTTLVDNLERPEDAELHAHAPARRAEATTLYRGLGEPSRRLTAAVHAPRNRPQRSRRKEETTEPRHRIALVLTLALAVVPAAPAAGPSSDRAPVVVRVTSGGFRWGDARIGAAGWAGPAALRRATRPAC